MPRGAFIVFEGGDRSGKTTQAKKVSEYFTKEGIKHQSIRFPSFFFIAVKQPEDTYHIYLSQHTSVMLHFTEGFLDFTSHGLQIKDRTSSIGSVIDQYLKKSKESDDHVIHLLFSANRYTSSFNSQDNLCSFTITLFDRLKRFPSFLKAFFFYLTRFLIVVHHSHFNECLHKSDGSRMTRLSKRLKLERRLFATVMHIQALHSALRKVSI